MARIKLPTAIGHLTDYRMSAPRAFTTSAGPFNRVAFAAAHDDPILGVVVNVYHVHWDPRLPQEIARAGSRILAFHVCDWLAPSKHMLLIDIPAIRSLVEATGYDGPIEVEIFSRDDWWRRDPRGGPANRRRALPDRGLGCDRPGRVANRPSRSRSQIMS